MMFARLHKLYRVDLVSKPIEHAGTSATQSKRGHCVLSRDVCVMQGVVSREQDSDRCAGQAFQTWRHISLPRSTTSSAI